MSSRPTSVAVGGAILFLSTTLARILGLMRNVAINAVFGHESGQYDAYLKAFNVPDTIFSLLASGAVASAFVPVFTDLLTTGREKQAFRVFSSVTNLIFLVVSVLVAGLFYMAPWLVSVQFGSTDRFDEIVHMSRILLPAQVAFMVGGVLQGTLYARREYLVPSVAMNLYNIGIILGALAISRFVAPAEAGMCWGALAGAWIGTFFLPILALRKNGTKYSPRIDWSDPEFRRVLALMAPIIIGQSLGSWLLFLLKIYAAGYGKAYVAAITNANELFQAPAGVFGQSFALAAFPVLSELWAKREEPLFHDQFLATLRQTLFLSIPVAAIFIAAPNEAVRLIYGYGKLAHEPESIVRVGSVLMGFGFGVPAWCVLPVLTRAYFATKSTAVPVVLSSLATLVFIGACWGIAHEHWPFPWFGYATSAVGTLLCLAQWVALERRVGRFKKAQLLATLVLTASGAAFMGLVVWVILFAARQVGAMESTWVAAPLTVLAFVVGAWVFYLFAVWSKMPEASYLKRALNRRKKPSSQEPSSE